MLTSIDVKFTFNGLFLGKFKRQRVVWIGSTNILQIADVVPVVVFLIFLLYTL